MSPQQIEAAIVAAMPDARVVVRDLTGTGDHFQAVVGSDAFEGQSLVQQHQMVYRALGSAVGGAIHALMLKTCPLAGFEKAAAEAAEAAG